MGDKTDIAVRIQIAAINGLNQDAAQPANDQAEDKKDYLDHEDEMIAQMLDKFLITSESAFLDTVNLQLMLMAMPTEITEKKVRRSHMFHFSVLEDSLTKFLNAD